MNEEKQIEEMAHCLCGQKNSCAECVSDYRCEFSIESSILYNAGYRKQEWISVEDRLPEEDIRVLVYLKSERSYTEIDTDRMTCGKWIRWGNDVTHWMPLPEAPKMTRKEDVEK